MIEAQVRAIFAEHLPDGVTVLNLDAREFTNQALAHPYIQLQVRMGVYSPSNIVHDFLSIARAHTESMLVVICMDLIHSILDGIPDDIAEQYLMHVAVHEAHHFHEHHEPVSALEHSESELQCVRVIEARYPNLTDAVRYVETNSPVYRRVYHRLDLIKRKVSVQ